jgi:hypothetical protein
MDGAKTLTRRNLGKFQNVPILEKISSPRASRAQKDETVNISSEIYGAGSEAINSSNDLFSPQLSHFLRGVT